MKSLEKEWETYTNAVYQDGMNPEQEKQLRQAFYAGFLIGQRRTYDLLSEDLTSCVDWIKENL